MRWNSVMTVAIALLVPQLGFGQATGTISGVVTGTGDRPLAGATVAVAGTTRGDQTDAQGRYTITAVPVGSRTLRATFASYSEATRTVTVAAGQTATANIPLVAQAVRLDAVVAVGYGTVRARDVTGSIGSVTAEDLATSAAPVASVASALTGRTAGVQVVTNSATPGASANIRIRGTNSITASSDPLYVVDGIPLSPGSTPLNAIDPNNIESIQVLKDASSTAIYGARGANGVVLVTTKRGQRGGSQISIESSYGYQKPSRFIEVLDSRDYMILVNEGLVNSGRAPKFSQAQIDDPATPYFDYPRELLQKLEWQPQQTHALTVSGGDAQTRYLLSGNYVDQQGIVLNSGFNRFGGRVNIDRTVSSKFRVGASLSGTRTTQEVNGGESTGIAGNNVGISAAMMYEPLILPRDPVTGVWNQRVQLSANVLNPITEANGQDNPNYTTAALTSLFGEYDLMEGLALRSTLGGNFNFRRNLAYSPSWTATGTPGGVASQFSSERRELTNENTLTLRRDIGPGSLDAVVGASIQTSNISAYTARAQGFPVDQLEFNNLGAGSTLLAPSSDVSEWTLLSQLGRINYNLLERYLFTVTARRDGSSRFGANNKWALFPSAAFAWRVIDEPILQNQRVFSDLKLRFSYGRTGNQAVDEYQSLARMTTAYTALGSNTDVVTLVPEGAAPNPDLKWETQDQFNAGIDLGFLDNRVSLTADAYQSSTSNLLLVRQLASRTGYASQLQNVGAVRNRGVELSLKTLNLDVGDLSWETTVNLSLNRNEVTQLYGGLQDLGAGSSTQVGEPLNTFVGYKVLGLYQQGDACNLQVTRECAPGEYKILDLNQDRIINDDDRVNLGSPEADYYGGFTSNLRYGPASLDAFFNFSKGNEMNNTAQRYMGLVAGASNERSDRALQRWTPQNTNTDVPRANVDRPNNRTYSTYIEEGSFLRLQTLTFGYDVPTQLIPGGYLDGARLMVSGQNLWLTTRYTGYDPENGGGTGSDNGGYPRGRTWNVGLNLTF
jgi:TonB-dependent starch-binding outer membrane protein SusC